PRIRIRPAHRGQAGPSSQRGLVADRSLGDRARPLRHLAGRRLGRPRVRLPDIEPALRRRAPAGCLRTPSCTGLVMAVAKLSRLSYTYPGAAEPALSEVCLEIGDGLTVVAGPSGGGKSTLLRVLNGLVPHFHGGRISGAASALGLDIIAT